MPLCDPPLSMWERPSGHDWRSRPEPGQRADEHQFGDQFDQRLRDDDRRQQRHRARHCQRQRHTTSELRVAALNASARPGSESSFAMRDTAQPSSGAAMANAI